MPHASRHSAAMCQRILRFTRQYLPALLKKLRFTAGLPFITGRKFPALLQIPRVPFIPMHELHQYLSKYHTYCFHL